MEHDTTITLHLKNDLNKNWHINLLFYGVVVYKVSIDALNVLHLALLFV